MIVASFYDKLLGPIAKPIAAILAAFYHVFPNYGVDIIVLSIAWMAIIAPLTLKSTRSMLAMQALQPEIERLKEKHKDDRNEFAQAQMELFRANKVSPFGACLPSLLPMPVFIALFRVLDGLSRQVTVPFKDRILDPQHLHVSQYLAQNNAPAHATGVFKGNYLIGFKHTQPQFLNAHTAMYHNIVSSGGHLNSFGVDLSQNLLKHNGSWFPYALFLLVMIGANYWQTASMMNRNPQSGKNPSMKMMKYIPIVFGIICVRFPAGLVLYYAVSSLFRLGQQYAMYSFDPKVKALATKRAGAVEARTREIDEEEAKQGKGPLAKSGGRSGSGSGSGGSGSGKGSDSSTSGLRGLLAPFKEAAEQAREQQTKAASNRNKSGSGSSSSGGKGSGSSSGSSGGGVGTRAKGGKAGGGGSAGAGKKGSGGSQKAGSGGGKGGAGGQGGKSGAAAGTRAGSRDNSRAGTQDKQQSDSSYTKSSQNGGSQKNNANGATGGTSDGDTDGQQRTGARTGAGSSGGRSPGAPNVGGRNYPAPPSRSKRRRKGR